MSTYDPFLMVGLGLAIFAVAAAVATLLVRRARARRRARRRVVEKPNSHYTSQLVKQAEVRHRWHEIDLDRIHEINREEVVRLLAKVEATSVDALRENERRFLDYMAEIASRRPAAEPRPAHRPVEPTLRQKPA